jgi:hypothetical protein
MSERAPRFSLGPKWQLLLMAALWTGLNCVKPVHVDDASYVRFAREFAQHPLDPYAFQMSWDQWPEPAIWSTASPVMTYWLASGAKWFYANPPILKLWMFPFAWLFVAGLYRLARRFVGAHELLLCWMTVFSAAFLPSLNFMLDVPVLAIEFVAVECICRACERNSTRLALLAGLLAAVAIETKYSAVLVLPVIGVAGLILRPLRVGVIAVATGVALVAAWEAIVAAKYGQCQFVAQLLINDPRRRIDLLSTIAALPAYFAGTAPFLLILGLRAIRLDHRLIALAAAVAAAAILLARVALFDALTAICIIVAAVAIVRQWRSESDPSDRRIMRFLLAWLAIEVVLGILLSTFPATRRLFGMMLVLTLVLGRCAFRRTGSFEDRTTHLGWSVACAICVCIALLYCAVDLDEATARKQSMASAIAIARQASPSGRTWYLGHWGAEYYGDRAGLAALVPDQSILHAGDVLIAADGVHTPLVRLPREVLEVIARPTTSYHLPWATTPMFYGGTQPLRQREPIDPTTPPGLQPTLLRVKRDCILASDFPLTYLVNLAKQRRSMAPDGLIRSLVGILANGADSEIRSAEQALDSIGERAMVIALRNESASARYFAAHTLEQQRGRLRDATIIALRAAMHDPDAAVRDAAARALGHPMQ